MGATTKQWSLLASPIVDIVQWFLDVPITFNTLWSYFIAIQTMCFGLSHL
jgi:hypothetical protein